MKYIDGVLTAVKTAKKQAFIDFSQATVALFREAGALEVVDCWGTDVPEGKVTSFPMAVKLEADEAVCFSWVL